MNAMLASCLLFIVVDAGFETSTKTVPFTRIKKQIVCYSCFSRNNPRVLSPLSSKRHSHENMTAITKVFHEAGLNVPVLAGRCADTLTSDNPNFYGSHIHICPNDDDEPGACVKFKGFLEGDAFVYRECWSKMWRDKRKFKHSFSGTCLSDIFIQSLFKSQQNTLCFCEDDLCNRSTQLILSHFMITAAIIINKII